MGWVAFADAEGAADLLGDDHSSQIVDSTDYSCCGTRNSLFAIRFTEFRPRPLAQVAFSATGGAPIAPLLLSYLSPFSVGVDAYIDPRADVGIRPYNNLQIAMLVSVNKERLCTGKKKTA